jgi:hypothetical protein
MNESGILKAWQYYDGTEKGYIDHAKAKNIIRNCHEWGYYIKHPDMPHLFSSPDGFMTSDSFNLLTQEPIGKLGLVEAKTLSYHGAKIWEAKIPVYYIFQVHHYFLNTTLDYAEIAVLKDGNKFDCYPIERRQVICDEIEENLHDFWYNHVLPAREIKQERDLAYAKGNRTVIEQCESGIAKLEPEVDSTDAYERYMSAKFINKEQSFKGTIPDLARAKRYQLYTKLMTLCDKERQLYRNHLVKTFVDNGTESIDFEENGTVTYRLKTGQKEKTFSCNLKIDVPKEQLEQLLALVDKYY